MEFLEDLKPFFRLFLFTHGNFLERNYNALVFMESFSKIFHAYHIYVYDRKMTSGINSKSETKLQKLNNLRLTPHDF